MPTASQAYLALDILASVPQNDGPDPLMVQARATLSAALKEPGWTGRSATCSEYGRQPLTDDSAERKQIITEGEIRR
jgi:hypothetical protein